MKLIEASYDKMTRISNVTIATECGNFTGTARLNPEDADIKSRCTGCIIAEMRAKEKYRKYKIKLLKERLIAIKQIKNNLDEINSIEKSLKDTVKSLQRQNDSMQDAITKVTLTAQEAHERIKDKID